MQHRIWSVTRPGIGLVANCDGSRKGYRTGEPYGVAFRTVSGMPSALDTWTFAASTLGLHPQPTHSRFDVAERWIAIDKSSNVPERSVFHMCWTLWDAHDSDLHLATGRNKLTRQANRGGLETYCAWSAPTIQRAQAGGRRQDRRLPPPARAAQGGSLKSLQVMVLNTATGVRTTGFMR
jgi:hypothetical protein